MHNYNYDHIDDLKEEKRKLIESVISTNIAMLTLLNELKNVLKKHGDYIDVNKLYGYLELSKKNKALLNKTKEN